MTAQAAQRSYLLELPAEIRLAIYDFVFPVKTIHIWIDWNVYRWRSYNPNGSISLLRTCRTIHEEAAPIFHNKTTVHFLVHDEFERPLSRYHRFSSLEALNANAFNLVSNVKLSLHTLTEPIFVQLLDHINRWLARLNFCAEARAIEIHFEFWSTIPDRDLFRIFDVLRKIKYNGELEIGTRAKGPWMTLYEGDSFWGCLEPLQDDIIASRRGMPMWMKNKEIGTLFGPRDLIIRSKPNEVCSTERKASIDRLINGAN